MHSITSRRVVLFTALILVGVFSFATPTHAQTLFGASSLFSTFTALFGFDKLFSTESTGYTSGGSFLQSLQGFTTDCAEQRPGGTPGYVTTQPRQVNTLWGASSGPYQPKQPLFGGSPGAQPHNSRTIHTASYSSGSSFNIFAQQGAPCAPVPKQSRPPTAPLLQPSATLLSAVACTVGTPHAISMTSADPDGDNIRYGIDWDANGSIDQWVPPSGYIPSGTTRTVARTYAVAGAKTVRVLAQDEGGLASDWASTSFTCSDATTIGLNEGGSEGSGDDTGTTFLPPSATLDLRVIPSLVRSGNTTKVNWSAVNVQVCTVTAPNGDNWTALASVVGGEASRPITGETTYTLSCVDLAGATRTRTTTVRIIPTFQEL